MLRKIFQEYKREYSLQGTINERKKQLIQLMQQNLRERIGDGTVSVLCLDGKEFSIYSENVEDLYAIDGQLNIDATSAKMNETADSVRENATSNNKYGPEKPYPIR